MRKLRRAVAKIKMRKKGIRKPFKKFGGESYFFRRCREYV